MYIHVYKRMYTRYFTCQYTSMVFEYRFHHHCVIPKIYSISTWTWTKSFIWCTVSVLRSKLVDPRSEYFLAYYTFSIYFLLKMLFSIRALNIPNECGKRFEAFEFNLLTKRNFFLMIILTSLISIKPI